MAQDVQGRRLLYLVQPGMLDGPRYSNDHPSTYTSSSFQVVEGHL